MARGDAARDCGAAAPPRTAPGCCATPRSHRRERERRCPNAGCTCLSEELVNDFAPGFG